MYFDVIMKQMDAELTDTNLAQAWIHIKPKINQSEGLASPTEGCLGENKMKKKMKDEKHEEHIHYLKLLHEKSSVYQPEIRNALNYAILKLDNQVPYDISKKECLLILALRAWEKVDK